MPARVPGSVEDPAALLGGSGPSPRRKLLIWFIAVTRAGPEPPSPLLVGGGAPLLPSGGFEDEARPGRVNPGLGGRATVCCARGRRRMVSSLLLRRQRLARSLTHHGNATSNSHGARGSAGSLGRCERRRHPYRRGRGPLLLGSPSKRGRELALGERCR